MMYKRLPHESLNWYGISMTIKPKSTTDRYALAATKNKEISAI